MFVPEINDVMTVSLPHESIRASVTRINRDGTIDCILDQAVPMTKLHGFTFEQRLKFERDVTAFGVRWKVVPGQAAGPVQKPVKFEPIKAVGDVHPPKPEKAPVEAKVKRRADAKR